MAFCPDCGANLGESQEPCTRCAKNIEAVTKNFEGQSDMVFSSVQQNNNTDVEELSLFGYYIKCFKNYVKFDGRARRKEYWGFYLFNCLAEIALAIVGAVLGVFAAIVPVVGAIVSGGFTLISMLYSLAVVLPMFAVWMRRLHDVGKSGLWMLAVFIPIVLGIVLIFISIVTRSPIIPEIVPEYRWIPGAVLVFVGAVFALITFIWSVLDSQRGSNIYGPNPKGIN